MRKTLFYLFVVISSLSFGSVEAKQKNLFRLENDTILHVCSNLSEMDCWTFGVSDDNSFSPSDYFTTYPYWRIKNIVIDEGVDSVYFGLYLISAKRLSIPSSLKYLYFSQEVPPGLEEVRLSAKNPNYRWENGALYSRDKTQLYFMLPSAVDSVLYIPEKVEQVWDIHSRYYPKDTLYLKDLPYRHWEGYLERYPKGIHYSKIVFPRHCKKYPEYFPSCDSLIILSEHCPEWLEEVAKNVSYLYCLSDSAVAHILQENLWDGIEWGRSSRSIDRGKIHCPNYDIRKRDTSWMRDNYRLTCVTGSDTLENGDSIPSGRSIQSVKIEGIADENVRFCEKKGRYRFYVATYDTLYQLPLEVFEKPRGRNPNLKWSDFAELRDSVFTIREGVDSLPYLRDMPSSFRKVILPKSMHYIGTDIYSIGTHITCDSVFIYSDSLDGADYIDAHYYYVENEQLYLSFKREFMERDRSAVVYCPNADIRKRDMTLQNMNKPVWRNEKGNVIKDLTYRPKASRSYLQVELEGMNYQDFYVLDCNRNRFLRRGSVYFDFINDGKTDELEYAVWTYDTLLPLRQKDTLNLVKRDGTPWTGGYDWKECVLYYVPEGTTSRSLLDSKDSILMWRSGDTIPRRYANRLAIGLILTNGEFDYSSFTHCSVFCLDKRNYFREVWESEIRDVNNSWLWKIPRQYKEFWLIEATEFGQDHGHSRYPPMHFYVGR